MKYLQMLCLVMLINNAQAKIDIFSIASNFKFNEFSMSGAIAQTPITSVFVGSAIMGFGLIGQKASNQKRSLEVSIFWLNVQKNSLQSKMPYLIQAEQDSMIEMKRRHAKYLKNLDSNVTSVLWDIYKESENLFLKCLKEKSKNERSIADCGKKISQLEKQIEAITRKEKITFFLASSSIGAGYSFWNFLAKNK